MRKVLLALASALVALLAFAATAPAAKHATVTASKSLAKGCQTKFVGRPRHTEVVRALSTAEGLVRARLKSRGDWDVARLRRQDEARGGRLGRLPRQRGRRGLRQQGPAPAGAGVPLRRPRLQRARGGLVPRRAGGRHVRSARRRSSASRPRRAPGQAAPADARPGPDRERRRRTRSRSCSTASRTPRSCRRPSSTTRCGWRTSPSAWRPAAGRPALLDRAGGRQRAAERAAPATATWPTSSSS